MASDVTPGRIVRARGVPGTAETLQLLTTGALLGVPGERVECVETHFAWVFLTGRDAYKLRKPVCFRGLDTRSPESRRARCLEELRLNQALAPGVYLEVLALTIGADGGLRLGGDGRAVDWLLHMRRLHRERMLDCAIRAGSVEGADLAALSAHLGAFYARQPGVTMTGAQYRQRLLAQVGHNRDELLHAAHAGVDTARVAQTVQLQARWIEVNGRLLGSRAARGWIRDGHGDLKPEHVCLGPPVSVIDRLDLEPDLRLLDPIEDLSFLWLECMRLGAADSGWQLVRACMSACHADAPESLAWFYLSHRALTRAKLGAWRLAGPDARRAHWHERVQDYIARAAAAMHCAAAGPR
jgi:aminoglycoside phosphotransferase family enzyme